MNLLSVALLAASVSWTVPPASGVVTRVINCCTLTVDFEGRTETVRMIGIDASDHSLPVDFAKRLSEEATRYAERTLLGRKIRLEFDVAYVSTGHRDNFDSILAYVFLGDTLINLAVVRHGYANADARFSSHTMDEIIAAAQEARRLKRGLWKDYVPPPDPSIYITPHSSHYHTGLCPNLGQNKTKIHVKTAAQLGFDACSICGAGKVYAETRGPAPKRTESRRTYHRYGVVTEVIDGDTIKVNVNGVAETVRMLGVDAPDFATAMRSAEHFSLESTRYARELLEGKKVRLEFDDAYVSSNYKDSDGRTLAYVYSAGSLFNLRTLKEGYSRANLKHRFSRRGEFRRAEREALLGGKGLWASGETAKDISVYISRSDKKYHLDPCLYLDQTRITTTSERAVKLGYKPCDICGASLGGENDPRAPLQ